MNTRATKAPGNPGYQGRQDSKNSRTVIFIASGFGGDLNAEQKVWPLVMVSVQACGR